ncbi:ATP-NAD kinase-like domain-containing protein [Tribonema minus]|uniref:Diacylglycerol kinase n=1 Tax=Tribonema minus TaxID=303371 RepID=A0A836CH11_9STRA|nr:ATP-NAD kinase-like domain-containing protein [Tribonema minus]
MKLRGLARSTLSASAPLLATAMPHAVPPFLRPSLRPTLEGWRKAQSAFQGVVQRLDDVVLWTLPSSWANPLVVMLVRLVIFYLLVRASAFFISAARFKPLRSDKVGGKFVPGRHSWVQIKETGLLRTLDPRYCGICKEVAHGISDGAMQCSICSCRAHNRCLRKSGASLPCKAVHRGQLLAPFPARAQKELLAPSGQRGALAIATRTPHQLVGCSVAAGKPCACCGELFRDERTGQRCTWCGGNLHNRCARSFGDRCCSLGRHRRLILPPAAVVAEPLPPRRGGGGGPASGNNRLQRAVHSVIERGPPKEAVNKEREDPTSAAPEGEPTAAGIAGDTSPRKEAPPPKPQSKTAWTARVTEVEVIERRRRGRGGARPAAAPRVRPRRGDARLDIDPAAIARGAAPLAVLVNTRSGAGARQGRELLAALRGALNPLQVADLGAEDPADFLRRFARVRDLRVLCCGGDGTVGWVLHAIDAVAWDRGPPPLAVLPMGTGNDLARTLGWGPGYDGTEDLNQLLETVGASHKVKLDRWSVEIEPLKAKRRGGGDSKSVPMGNYMGIGVDGQVALEFHNMREAHSGLFFSRVVNKVVYAGSGLRNILFPSCQELASHVEIYVDGERVELPPDTESVIILNINSYAGGSRLWTPEGAEGGAGGSPGGGGGGGASPVASAPSAPRLLFRDDALLSGGSDSSGGGSGARADDDRSDDSGAESAASWGSGGSAEARRIAAFGPSRIDDGLLEVVAVTGVLHLGRIQVGIGSGYPVAQGKELRIRTTRTLPMQVDGEPWRQAASDMVVRAHPQASMLRPSTPEEGRLRDKITFHEQVVKSAKEKGLVDDELARKLVSEAAYMSVNAPRSGGGGRPSKMFLD